jgi:hypothetical protein
MLLCAQAKQSKGAMTEMTAGPTALGGGGNFAARAELARVAAALEALASLENLGDGDGGGGDGGGGDGGGGDGGGGSGALEAWQMLLVATSSSYDAIQCQ